MKKVTRIVTAISVLLLAAPLRAADDGGLLKIGYYAPLGSSVDARGSGKAAAMPKGRC